MLKLLNVFKEKEDFYFGHPNFCQASVLRVKFANLILNCSISGLNLRKH